MGYVGNVDVLKSANITDSELSNPANVLRFGANEPPKPPTEKRGRRDAEISALAPSLVGLVKRGRSGWPTKRLCGNPENRRRAGGAGSLERTCLRCEFPDQQGKYREFDNFRTFARAVIAQ